LALGICATPPSVQAVTTIYTNETDFVAAAGVLPQFLNEFTNLTYLGWLAHPIQAASNGISYRIESAPPLYLYTYTGVVSTLDTTEAILVTFTSGNVTGAGGYFYAANGTNGAPTTGTVTVALDDGTVTNVASADNSTPLFIGFISDGPIYNSLTITNSSGGSYHPALSHFYVVAGIPSPAVTLTSSNYLNVSWYSAPTDLVLQSSATLQGAHWTNVPQAPQLTNNYFHLQVPISGPAGFFRLMKP
jgi:hypothetical protein